MKILKTIAEARAACREFRGHGQQVGLVPTMGALHAGHLSLVKAAREQCDAVVVSIFVNPTQFGPNEDYAAYPRTLEADCALLAEAGADVVFAPSAEEMYGKGESSFVVVEGPSERLDGGSRPGHFRGVTTVVSKLLHIVTPNRAFFGQKDAAQVAVLRRMVRELNFGTELVVCPIVREASGLALSSRNKYLSEEQREQALVLHRALERAEEWVAAGVTSSARLLEGMCTVIAEEPAVRIDYVAAVNAETLEDVAEVGAGSLLAVAAFVGTTRLIDNTVIGELR
jgi:pantoate--beta-alanine ligase